MVRSTVSWRVPWRMPSVTQARHADMYWSRQFLLRDTPILKCWKHTANLIGGTCQCRIYIFAIFVCCFCNLHNFDSCVLIIKLKGNCLLVVSIRVEWNTAIADHPWFLLIVFFYIYNWANYNKKSARKALAYNSCNVTLSYYIFNAILFLLLFFVLLYLFWSDNPYSV